jgi:hypothetical protein
MAIPRLAYRAIAGLLLVLLVGFGIVYYAAHTRNRGAVSPQTASSPAGAQSP